METSLVETDGTNDGPNKNSGEDRTIPLTFAGSSGSYTATLSFATKDDTSDANGQGTITVTLKENTTNSGTYTVSSRSGENTATVSVIEVPTPELTIHNVAVPANEGSVANIVVRASENPKRTLRFNYTPTETNTTYLAPIDQDSTSKGSGTSRYVDLTFAQATPNSSDPWLATIAMATQQAVGLEGTISVQLVAGAGYTVGSPDTATVTVDDISIPELSIAYVETETLAGK